MKLSNDGQVLLNVEFSDILNGTVDIPDSVTHIWGWAFFGCTGLTQLTIPNSVTHINYMAFFLCTGLTELTLPSSLTHIGPEAFSGCTGLTQLTIPNSVTHIGDRSFEGCYKFQAVFIDAENDDEHERIVNLLEERIKKKTIPHLLAKQINEMRRRATNEFIAISFPSMLPKVLLNIVLEYDTPKTHLINQIPLPQEERLLPLYERRLNLLISKQKHLVNNPVPHDGKQAIKRILLNYLEGRINVKNASGDTAQYFHARFFPVQKSFDEKEKAVYALLDALDGNSHGLKEHLSTLRNGRLGKALREFIQKGVAFDIVGDNVTTVRQFVDAIVNPNSVKVQTSCSDIP